MSPSTKTTTYDAVETTSGRHMLTDAKRTGKPKRKPLRFRDQDQPARAAAGGGKPSVRKALSY
jgi:hypothetical protein